MTILDFPRASITPQQITDIVHQIVPLAAQLPHNPLYAPERRELGGLILPLTPGLVASVSDALTDHPERFPKAPVSGPDLRERQSCANLWLALRNYLQVLLEQANDNYLLTQAQAARDANAVLDSAKAAPADDPLRKPRILALVGAYFLVDDYHKRIQKKRAARRAARAAASGDAPAPRRPKKTTPSGAHRAVMLRRGEQLIREVLHLFHLSLRPPTTPPAGSPPPTPPSADPSHVTETSNTDHAQELRDLLEKKHGPLTPPRPEDPALWSRVADLDRSSGRLIYADQILQSGGEAGELTVAAAVHGLCEGACKKAADIIAAPDTPPVVANRLRGAFCEPLRVLEEFKLREAQQQKTLEDSTRPIQDAISQSTERATLTRAMEAFLAETGPGMG